MMKLEVPHGISAAERETVVRWDDEDKTVTIWSASPVVLRRLHKLGLTPTSESRRRDGTLHGREFKIELARFRWGLKRRQGSRQNPPFLPRRPGENGDLGREQAEDRATSQERCS